MPAFLVPLCSYRGSLARFRRVLVLVNASVFDCVATLTGNEPLVNIKKVTVYERHGKRAWCARRTISRLDTYGRGVKS